MAVIPRRVSTVFPLLAVYIGVTVAWRAAGTPLLAQGTTTAAISGVVRAEGDAGAEGAVVAVVNRSTGFSIHTVVRNGRFAALGLEVGGPYSVVVRRPGFTPRSLDALVLSLGQRLEIEMSLDALPARLDTVRVVATAAIASTYADVSGTISRLRTAPPSHQESRRLRLRAARAAGVDALRDLGCRRELPV